MSFCPDVSLAHFQLRRVLACPSRTQALYSSPDGVTKKNLSSGEAELALNLREFPAMGGVISTLDAGHGVVMGGTFNGDYCIRPLDSEGPRALSEGQISPDAIMNHLRIHTPRRSARPVASIASNDRGFRVMDLETEKLISATQHGWALNCSACSPDRRLRVLVGDSPKALIVSADTGETLQELAGHYDYGFACDWSDDGWTVATGFQDKAVKVWDARRWCDSCGASTPLCTLRSEMAGVRGLRFLPLGSGRPVLAAAEEADFVNLVDARTFASKQTVDVFGEIGGLAFADEGHDLVVLCCDAHRGGLVQLERCGDGPRPAPPRARPDDDAPWADDEWLPYRRPTLLLGPDPFSGGTAPRAQHLLPPGSFSEGPRRPPAACPAAPEPPLPRPRSAEPRGGRRDGACSGPAPTSNDAKHRLSLPFPYPVVATCSAAATPASST